MDNKEIGNRIKTRRKELGFTLKEIADKVGVASSTIQRYENGTISQYKLPILESIAKALNVNPVWFTREDATMEIKIDNNKNDFIPLELKGLSNEQLVLLENYKKLNQVGKSRLLEYSYDLTDTPKYRKDNKVVEIPSNNKESENELCSTLMVDEENAPYILAAHSDEIDEETNRANIEKIKSLYDKIKK